MIRNQSVLSTISGPEFINLKESEISPLISECDIKVCYVGQNRNHSSMSKEVLTKMSKTLRGNPIVGAYKKSKQDFTDHGEVVTIDSEGVHEDWVTVPYGFVKTDSKVWFQCFDDIDEFGNTITREYLCVTGYLWTGQYEECKKAITEGQPQSMELDEKNFPIDGHWATDNKSGREFFIINDATFSKLCILGDDVEPCFEGSSVTQANSKFTCVIDNTFKDKFDEMMQEFHKFSLLMQGGQEMSENNEVMQEQAVEAAPAVEAVPSADVETSFKCGNDDEDKKKYAKDEEEEKKSDDEKKSEDAPKKEDKADEGKKSEDKKTDDKKSEDKKDDEEEDVKKKYSVLCEQYEELCAKYKAMETEYQVLKTFKMNADEAAKDALIATFNMLDDTDTDKMAIVADKAKYSLEELEAKLSVLCYRKKVNFNLESLTENDTSKEVNEPITTFTMAYEDTEYSGAPSWLKGVDDYKKNI